MKIERIILRHVRMPLARVYENRWQQIRTWNKVIAEVRSTDGAVGWGECMAMETPFYSYETIETAVWVIRKWLAQPLLEHEFEHPREISELFASVAGHHEGKATLENACWDLYARAQSKPLHEVLGGRLRPVATGATVGVQKDIPAAVETARVAVDSGYDRLKLKIKPGWDEDLIAAVRDAFPDVRILADANGAYGPDDVDWLARLDRFAPIVIEQPFPKAAWIHTAALQASTEATVCLDESIEEMGDVEHLLHLEAASLVNLKVGRVGGLAEAVRIHDRCREVGVPVFIGSKTETGIGRRTNIALGTLDNVGYPSDVAASERYFVEEIVRDPVTLVSPGHVSPLDAPGLGSEPDRDRLLEYTNQTEVFPL